MKMEMVSFYRNFQMFGKIYVAHLHDACPMKSKSNGSHIGLMVFIAMLNHLLLLNLTMKLIYVTNTAARMA